MQMTDNSQSTLAPVKDFQNGRGWERPGEAEGRAKWCCEQLEDGRVLFFDVFPFDFPEEDRSFLVSQRLGDSRFHKNISYRPKQDALRGFAPGTPRMPTACARRCGAIRSKPSDSCRGFSRPTPPVGRWITPVSGPRRNRTESCRCASGTTCCTWTPFRAGQRAEQGSCAALPISTRRRHAYGTRPIPLRAWRGSTRRRPGWGHRGAPGCRRCGHLPGFRARPGPWNQSPIALRHIHAPLP